MQFIVKSDKLYNKSSMELEGYSWPTCSKQPQLVNRRIGVVNKFHRRRRRDRRAVAKFSKSRVWELPKFP